MFNLGGGEILVILLLALIVLGPAKLPEAARKMGQALNELKKISKGFQDEFQAVIDEPVEADARAKGDREVKAHEARAAAQRAAKESTESARLAAAEAEARRLGSGTDHPDKSTAAAAGMYDATSDLGDSAEAEAPPEPDPGTANPFAAGAPSDNGDGSDDATTAG